MGRLRTWTRKYHIKALKPVHYQILVRLCWCKRPKDIARELGVCRQTVSNVSNSRIGVNETARLNAEIEALAIGMPIELSSGGDGLQALRDAHIAAYNHPKPLRGALVNSLQELVNSAGENALMAPLAALARRLQANAEASYRMRRKR